MLKMLNESTRWGHICPHRYNKPPSMPLFIFAVFSQIFITCRLFMWHYHQVFLNSVLPCASARQRQDVISRKKSVLNRMVLSVVAALKESQIESKNLMFTTGNQPYHSLYHVSSFHAFASYILTLNIEQMCILFVSNSLDIGLLSTTPGC